MTAERLLPIGEWRLDPLTRYAKSSAGKTVRLTKGEFDLLSVFMSHADTVLSRGELMVLSQNRSKGPSERTIDVLVGRLRRKLEPDQSNPTQITTVWSEGYVFKSETNT
jgi:two-component system torCAD operon response regulator TorR